MGTKRRTVTFSQYGINLVAELNKETNMYYYMDMDSSLRCTSLSDVRNYAKRRMEEFILKEVTLTQAKYESLNLEKRGLRFSENDYLAALYSQTRKKVMQPELWATIKCSYELKNKKERLDAIREKMSFKTVHKAGRNVSTHDVPDNTEKKEITDGGNKAAFLYPEGRKPVKLDILKKVAGNFAEANGLGGGCMEVVDLQGMLFLEITGKDLYILFPCVNIHNIVINAAKTAPTLTLIPMTGNNIHISYKKGRLTAQKAVSVR